MAERIDDTAPEWASASGWQPRQPAWSGPPLLILATSTMYVSDVAPWDNGWEPSPLVEGPIYVVRVCADPVLQPRRAAITLPRALRETIVHGLAQALVTAYRRRQASEHAQGPLST